MTNTIINAIEAYDNARNARNANMINEYVINAMAAIDRVGQDDHAAQLAAGRLHPAIMSEAMRAVAIEGAILTPEYRKDYRRGQATSERDHDGTLFDRALMRNESDAWIDGYQDRSAGRPDWSLAATRALEGTVTLRPRHVGRSVVLAREYLDNLGLIEWPVDEVDEVAEVDEVDEVAEVDEVDELVCDTCSLISSGYSAEELGLSADHDTPAVHYVVSAGGTSGSEFGECSFCGEFATVWSCHTALRA